MYSVTGYKQGSLFQITNKRHVQQNIHTEIIQYRSASNKGSVHLNKSHKCLIISQNPYICKVNVHEAQVGKPY